MSQLPYSNGYWDIRRRESDIIYCLCHECVPTCIFLIPLQVVLMLMSETYYQYRQLAR
jgi:hypothetical protein